MQITLECFEKKVVWELPDSLGAVDAARVMREIMTCIGYQESNIDDYIPVDGLNE